ncbi:MAG: 1-acyl-sn-glycerol-3-phosphate acyltransferase [Caldilinea sp.]|nr:1-acyl-sn-glycerol-3-phosphate acyltransferase [Caldilinea sp.]MDW8439976.1 lysophospholipid acyltransferase family protein [Caldilineaceae bacterium]
MFAGSFKPPGEAIWSWKALHLFVTAVKPFFCRLQVEGREHIPLHGGCVLTCNHTMGPDFLVLSYLSPRQVYFMVKAELMEANRWLGKFLSYNGCFPVRRGEGDMDAVQHAIDVVRRGCILGMFPEGTRSRTGKLQRGRSGAAYIAIQAQAPVVPAAVINSEAIFKRSNYLSLKPRVRVTARIGRPLTPPKDVDDRRSLRSFTRDIMAAIAALLPPELRKSTEEMEEA